jgi:plastocyanin
MVFIMNTMGTMTASRYRITLARPVCLLLAGWLVCQLPAVPEAAAVGARVSGKVFVGKGKSASAANSVPWSLGQAVVFLIPQDRPAPVEPPETRAVVHQKNANFEPSFLAIRKGQTVDFVNDDDIAHNVFSFSPRKKFDLGIYPKGQKKSVTFDREGPVLYFCSIHESMNGIIYVVPSPYYALTNSLGNYAIDAVPPGRYIVRTWHSALPQGEKFLEVRTLDVTEGKPVQLDINLAR